MPIYMKYEGIVGQVKGVHAGWIELESCQIGGSKPPSGVGSTTPKQSVSDLFITKNQDTTTVALFREATSGKGRKVVIDFVNGDGVAYMTLELESAMVSSMKIGAADGPRPMESLTLNFAKIKYTTKPAGPAADANPQGNQSFWNAAP